jgi:hypothetical protein
VYSVIKFQVNGNTVWFNGDDNIIYKPGETVPVRYPDDNPKGARINDFVNVWGDTVVFGGLPALVIFFVYIHPLIVPRRSKLRLGWKKPFLQVA